MPTHPFGALTCATEIVAKGLPEEQLMHELSGCARSAVAADVCAVYLLADEAPAEAPEARWRLGAVVGADPARLAGVPAVHGRGDGCLSALFGGAKEIVAADLLDGAPPEAALPSDLPGRSLAGLPIRRRDGRQVGALLLGAARAGAFDSPAVMATLRAVAQLLGIGIDTARQVAARQREQRRAATWAVTLETVLESVGSGVCVVDLDGTLRLANKTLQELFGFTVAVTAGVSEESIFASAQVAPREANAFLARLRELVDDPAQKDESEWELATDPPRIVQRHSEPVRNHLGEVVGRVEVYTDVSEERRLYTQLLHSEKLRAIGEMASGVAHDFNNLLATIVGQTDLLHAEDLSPATRLAITTIRQAALDGARMVRNLQGLARPRAETPSTSADLNETVQLAVEMARPRWATAALHGHGSIEVRLALDDAQLPRVAIDPAELREVLLNLLFNAMDAMPEGGRIEITTRPSRTPGAAELEVRDTGCGMPESVRARIFEPFYSTKGPKGSGLGLAVAYSIISRRGGEIGVDSRVGEGTTFTIRLPYVPNAAQAAAQGSPQARPSALGQPATQASRPAAGQPATQASRPAASASQLLKGSRILVADDEPGLVTIVRQLMERSGASVSIANGGRAAVEALQRPGERFDIVITDLDMPEVDGWAVTAEAKARQPGCHVVMLTGWAGEIAPEDFARRGVDAVLGKPCSRADLEAAIGELLAPPPAPASGLDVLLVDDEPVFARSVRDLLGLQGHRVEVVDSAAAALAAVDGRTFDVVITDYSLGGVTGAQLAEQLADRPHSPFVVLITGYATHLDDPSLLTRGVSAVLPKPCRGEDLRTVLARASA